MITTIQRLVLEYDDPDFEPRVHAAKLAKLTPEEWAEYKRLLQRYFEGLKIR